MTQSLLPIDRVLADTRLLGASLDMTTRQTWLTVWKAAYALPLTVKTESFIRWRYLWWALSAVGVMIAAIVIGNTWLLDFVHVFSSLLWTGIDLFMGFVLGPILRRVDLPVRREIMRRLTPRIGFWRFSSVTQRLNGQPTAG